MKSLKQFADEHGITLRAAQRHIQRHEDELDGHVVRYGPPRGTFVDDFAIEFLSGLIAGPPMTFVSATQEANELRAELEEANKKILALLEDKVELTQRALQAEGTLALSEASVATKEEQIQQLMDQVDKLKGRTLWQRIMRWGE